MAQSQQNQHNGYGIDGIEHGNGNAQNHAQSQVAHEKREKGNDIHPLFVGNLPEQGGKILGNGVDEPYAGGQTRQGEDSRQQHRAGSTEDLVDDAPQGPGTVFLNVVDPGAAHPHVRQHDIDQSQDGAGQHARQDGVAHSILLFRQAEGAQGGGDDQAEVQSGNGVHGVVALGKALEQGGTVVAFLGGSDLNLSPEQKADEEQRQQGQKGRREHPANPIYQFTRV